MTEFIQQQNLTREDYKNQDTGTKTPTYRKVLRHKSTRGITIVTVFAIAVPFLIYYLVIDEGSYPEPSLHTCAVNVTYRVPCGNKVNATAKDCARINCCHDSHSLTCYHFLPSKYYYYQKNDNFLASQKNTPFGTPQSADVSLTIDEVSEDVVKIILHNSNVAVTGNTQATKKYSQKMYTDKLAVEIFRAASGDLILTTAIGPMIVSENYWEWTFQLTEDYLFGLGETLFDFEELNTTFTKVVYNNKYDQNTLPVFMGYLNDSFHGMMVHHEGPLEVTVLASNLVILRTLVGSKIELELSLGPTPQDVTAQQRTEKSEIPPWALGVHVCRGGSTTSLESIMDEYEADASVKYDSDCIHENLWLAMLLNTDDAQKDRLVKAVTDLEATSTKFVMSLPPQVPIKSSFYSDVVHMSLFYLNQSEEVYQGKYFDTDVAYPYFGHKSVGKFMTSVREEIKEILGVDPTNFVLTSNWPEEDSYKMDGGTGTFPYLSDDLMEALSNTLPWNTKSDNIFHIYQHNDYGSLQLTTWENALNPPPASDYFLMTSSRNLDTKSRPVLIENVDISWTNLKKSIRTMLFNSLFGSNLVSVPVCGSTKNYDKALQESLCMRWYLMASTSPLFRISSDLPRRDPDSLNTKFATETATFAIDMRKKLLPYYQTVLNKGEPLIRPMFYNFYRDTKTFGLDEQYMVGDSLLVAHPVVPDSSELRIYLPGSNWYEFFGGELYTPGWTTIDIVETDWIGFIPEGSVMPLISKGTDDVPEDSLTFIIGLACNQTDACFGSGYLDFGSDIRVTFEATMDELTLSGITKDARNGMGCNAGRTLKVDEMSVYKNNSVNINPLSSSVDLCEGTEEVVIIKYPEQ